MDRHELEAGMTRLSPASRRHLLVSAALGGILASACGRARRRPGRLTYLLRGEPWTLDPALSAGGSETWIMSALFEPLIQPHPQTMTPMAGLVTHYKVECDGTRYTFYLRGHPAPEGTPLAGPDSLPVEFTRGLTPSPHNIPARWSDGVPITAHDVVYSWRRYLAPETGCPNAYVLYCLAGAEAINQGRISPEQLGVCAVDTYTLEVNLTAPAPHFLMLCYTTMTLPMPRHVIEAARKRETAWTDPGRIVTSGPFTLKESRPREGTIVERNPLYFDYAFAGIDEIHFFPADGATVVNLFRTGLADSMDGRVLPLQLAPGMQTTELHISPACASHNWRINTTRAPLDNPLLRYALNMATDKIATTRFLGAGQLPAASRVPPLKGYVSPQRMDVEINGNPCDVLAYNPRAARELWEAIVLPAARAPLPIRYFARVDSQQLAEILQKQWQENLGLETRFAPQETAAYIQAILSGNEWDGVAEDSYFASFPDPYDLLSLYIAPYPNWSDPKFDRMLATANSTTDRALRMEKLSQCEAALLAAMPFVPLYFDTWVYLERREIHGLHLSPIGVPAFKYAWIDTNWKPA
jgi:oligopeptide transport system substrate-binding protein